MAIGLLTAAKLMTAAYEKTTLSGWAVIATRHDKSGLDATVFKRGTDIAVCLEGQRFWRWDDFKAILRRKLKGTYHPAGENFVRALQISHNHAEITMIGHSGGGGWGAYIAKKLGLKAIAMGAGASALQTNDDTDNDSTVSLEIEGDRWGNSGTPSGLKRARVMRFKTPPGRRKGLIAFLKDHGSHNASAYVEALEANGEG